MVGVSVGSAWEHGGPGASKNELHRINPGTRPGFVALSSPPSCAGLGRG